MRDDDDTLFYIYSYSTTCLYQFVASERLKLMMGYDDMNLNFMNRWMHI